MQSRLNTCFFIAKSKRSTLGSSAPNYVFGSLLLQELNLLEIQLNTD